MKYKVRKKSGYFGVCNVQYEDMKVMFFNDCPNAEQLAHELCDKMNEESRAIWSTDSPERPLTLRKGRDFFDFRKKDLCKLLNGLEECRHLMSESTHWNNNQRLEKALDEFGIGEETP